MDISRLEASAEGISERLAAIDETLETIKAEICKSSNRLIGGLTSDMPDIAVGIMAAILEASNPIENKDQVPPHIYAGRARDLFLAAMQANLDLDADRVRVVPGWHRPMTADERKAAREREERGEDV